MPSAETLERFIARVESNAHAEAIEEFYTADASMQENEQPPRRGRDELVEHGTRMRMDEIAYQRWEDDRVAEEKFFYDPRQLAPKE